MTIGERIKSLRESKGLTQDQLAEKIGVSRATIAKYENGFTTPKRNIEELSTFFKVSTDYLLCKTDIPYPVTKANKIPVLGRIAAGVPFEAVQNIEEYEEILDSWGDPREYFALRIQGHSMEPRIWNGDIVIVHKQSDADSGKVCVVLVNGNDATVKQIKKSDSGITLIGFNASVYPPHFYSKEEVVKLPVQIVGVVREVRGTL